MKFIKITILLLIVAVLVNQTNIIGNLFSPRAAYAVGDLQVTWGEGVTPGDPIFTIQNMAPGDSTSEEVTIKNNASSARPVALKGVATDDADNLSTQMNITITDGDITLYGPKTVGEFFTDSADPEGIPLSTINPGDTTTYTMNVTFKESAGNDFQNTSLTFNIVIGIDVAIPVACENIDLKGRFPVFGTTGNDTINGTNKDDVIFGLEGNDKINGGNGHDCIVGGLGNDTLTGGNGHDYIVGNEGNDKIDSGNGNDTVTGDAGEDSIQGGNGTDTLSGGEGDDKIDGGNEADTISGGTGTDTLTGGTGNDTIFGDDGDDTIKGGTGNDTLDGGAGQDTVNGEVGRDTCAGETLKSCELAL